MLRDGVPLDDIATQLGCGVEAVATPCQKLLAPGQRARRADADLVLRHYLAKVPDYDWRAGLRAEAAAEVRAEFAEAVCRGELIAAVDSPEAVRLFTVMISRLISQQMANQPDAAFATGVLTRLTEEGGPRHVPRPLPHRRNNDADARP